MVRGGVEKELITVLKKMDPKEYCISVLLLYEEDNKIISEIPQNIEVINLDIDKKYYLGSTKSMIKARIINRQIIDALNIGFRRLFNIGLPHQSQSFKRMPRLNQEYDIAICYHMHSQLIMKYVIENITAKKKIAWIHNDFKTSGYKVQKGMKYLKKYDEFVAVSNQVKDEFIEKCPSFSNNTYVVNNIIDEYEVLSNAKKVDIEDAYYSEKKMKLLTVGRFTPQKGIDLAIEVCAMLKKSRADFIWYVIGWGPEKPYYEMKIKEYALEDCFIILGEKENPYPYIDNCDIYIQPSRHEAWGLVVQEARILSKPIICTDFAGASEQIINQETGYIVPCGNTDSLKNTIEFLLNNPDERKRLHYNLCKKKDDICNINEIINRFK